MEGISRKTLESFKKDLDNTGVVYISRIPPGMKPLKIKQLLSHYGEIGRIYLAAEDPKTRENRKKAGGNRKKQYQEGWVEFMDKKVGKTVAATLNNQIIGGKKSNYYHDDIWNLKYLPRFKWIHLNEQLAYERQERQKTIQIETDQAKREVDVYLKNFAKSKKRIRAAQTDNDGEGRPVKNFRQREAVEDEPLIDQAILKKLI